MSNQPIVLVVDDDIETSRIFEMLLTKMSYQTLMAANVPQALVHLENSIPDMILLDIMLPGQSGIELLEHIRSTPHLSEVFVIIISAHTLNARDLPDGVYADHILRKPIRIPELKSLISQVLA